MDSLSFAPLASADPALAPLPPGFRESIAVPAPTIRRLGRADYGATWQAMQEFTATRGETTPDELWLLEHPPVYTLGLAGRAEDLLEDKGIPLVKSDRGGQITYHGPGQVIVYLLIDLTRARLKVRDLVTGIEEAVVALLSAQGIAAHRRAGAPGVYVGGVEEAAAAKVGALDAPQKIPLKDTASKIAALGLRVRRGRCYHGVSLNVDMDLSPFRAINPCGYAGLAVTSLREQGSAMTLHAAGEALLTQLMRQLEIRA